MKMESLTQRDICTPMFAAVLFPIAKTWKQPKCPLIDTQDGQTSEWIKKMWYTHTHTHAHTEILFSHKKGNAAI